MITPARFTYRDTDSEQNRIELRSILFDWFLGSIIELTAK